MENLRGKTAIVEKDVFTKDIEGEETKIKRLKQGDLITITSESTYEPTANGIDEPVVTVRMNGKYYPFHNVPFSSLNLNQNK